MILIYSFFNFLIYEKKRQFLTITYFLYNLQKFTTRLYSCFNLLRIYRAVHLYDLLPAEFENY